MLREIVVIDEEKCDGCGQCVPACHEGAIQVIDGKARLIADRLCDGLGACLGHCPQDAIRVERREAVAFDEQAVEAHLSQQAAPKMVAASAQGCPGAAMTRMQPAPRGGCPSAMFNRLAPAEGPAAQQPERSTPTPVSASELTHWPVQLRLLPPTAPVLQNANVLVAADCVSVAMPDFHARLLRGRAVLIACPKLDDPDGYVEKIAEMIRMNDLADITVAHMEVPCCTGILNMVLEARRRSGKSVPVKDVVISTRGEVLTDREVPQ